MTMLLTSLVLVCVTSRVTCDLFTSSFKIEDLVGSEGRILDVLKNHIYEEYDRLKMLSDYYHQRSKLFYTSIPPEGERSVIEHPNGAYLTIKRFWKQWAQVVADNPRMQPQLKDKVPTYDDYAGAMGSLVRLQEVYRLKPADMYAGNYLGHRGPRLESDDPFQIGRQAFSDGYLNSSIEWLEFALKLLKENEDSSHQALSSTAALLGRSYNFNKNNQEAWRMYNYSSMFDPNNGDVMQLKQELEGETPEYAVKKDNYKDSMTELCLRDKYHRVSEVRPYHVCRLRTAFAPNSYLTFKEEILSLQPYASVIYDVITDSESDIIMNYARDKGLLTDAQVVSLREDVRHDRVIASVRLAQRGWIHDDGLAFARHLSERITLITGLNVDQRPPNGPSSAEALQVVNYGLGGHYSAHMDPFDHTVEEVMLRDSGDRIATFLLYLTDVVKGGNTAFVNANISVSPIRNMALLWYNFSPDYTRDEMTTHCGCPVLIGQKWIANKWIWTYGNTFRRPCGMSPSATQLDVEKMLAEKARLNNNNNRTLCNTTKP